MANKKTKKIKQFLLIFLLHHNHTSVAKCFIPESTLYSSSNPEKTIINFNDAISI